MSFGTFEEIVRFAIEKEEEAIAFYEEIASREPYSGIRETFEGFAGEERKHRELLADILKGKKGVSGYSFTWIPDLKRSNYMVEVEYEKGMPYPDVLRLAVKREEKALSLYNDLQEKAEGEELVLLFKMLCQEEAKHKLALESLYDDYMKQQGD
ncbi:MAG: ferritin family protein [Deltaproteobacteria bacterium]|nr:ferritin family protein [Deltaproteobacteria bacterium]